MRWYFHTTLQPHNLPVDCARELFKLSKDTASLQAFNEKKFVFVCFYEWHHKWSRFLAILAQVTYPWAQLQGGSILLKFLFF